MGKKGEGEPRSFKLSPDSLDDIDTAREFYGLSERDAVARALALQRAIIEMHDAGTGIYTDSDPDQLEVLIPLEDDSIYNELVGPFVRLQRLTTDTDSNIIYFPPRQIDTTS